VGWPVPGRTILVGHGKNLSPSPEKLRGAKTRSGQATFTLNVHHFTNATALFHERIIRLSTIFNDLLISFAFMIRFTLQGTGTSAPKWVE